MDINTLNKDGEWLELDVETEKIDKLRFKIRPVTANDEIRAIESGQNIVRNIYKTILEVVVDWEMTDGDAPYPCTKENKESLMPYLVGLTVVSLTVEGEEDGKKKEKKTVGGEIAKFAQKTENFLKN